MLFSPKLTNDVSTPRIDTPVILLNCYHPIAVSSPLVRDANRLLSSGCALIQMCVASCAPGNSVVDTTQALHGSDGKALQESLHLFLGNVSVSIHSDTQGPRLSTPQSYPTTAIIRHVLLGAEGPSCDVCDLYRRRSGLINNDGHNPARGHR